VPEPTDVGAGSTTGSDTRVDVIETEDLTVAQRAAVIEVCVAAHVNENFRNLFNYTTDGARHFLGWRGDELVSHAMVTTRWLEPIGFGILRTAYVDAVSTLPAAQGLGCASAVMRQLAGSIGDYEVGCLQTDIAPFYERLGWRLWQGELYGRSDDALIPTPEQRGVMVLALAHTPLLDVNVPLSVEVQPERIWE
jgi:GNAT superfamily N-acetyltransferase